MKIPLTYPKIPDGTNCPLKKCIAFEKLDGTNLHWVWDKGWRSFGTRRESYDYSDLGFQEFSDNHKLFGAAYYFGETYATKLEEFFLSKKEYTDAQVTVFTEFLGANSFAGQHEPNDHKKLILFDVQVVNDIISPEQFLSNFSKFPIAKVVYKGKYTGQFVEDVRNGKYPVNEGVVVKGVVDGQVYMTKVKTKAYMEKLKLQFKDKWQDYWE